MKSSVAIMAGVALVGGVLVVRQLVASEPSSASPETTTHVAPTASPHTNPRSVPRPALPPPPVAIQPSDESPAAPLVPAQPETTSAGSASAEASGSGARVPTGAPATVPRPGTTALKKPLPSPEAASGAPRFTGEDGVAQRKQFKRVTEAAACRAPDLQTRLAKLPPAKRAELVKLCAKYDVTLREPKR